MSLDRPDLRCLAALAVLWVPWAGAVEPDRPAAALQVLVEDAGFEPVPGDMTLEEPVHPDANHTAAPPGAAGGHAAMPHRTGVPHQPDAVPHGEGRPDETTRDPGPGRPFVLRIHGLDDDRAPPASIGDTVIPLADRGAPPDETPRDGTWTALAEAYASGDTLRLGLPDGRVVTWLVELGEGDRPRTVDLDLAGRPTLEVRAGPDLVHRQRLDAVAVVDLAPETGEPSEVPHDAPPPAETSRTPTSSTPAVLLAVLVAGLAAGLGLWLRRRRS